MLWWGRETWRWFAVGAAGCILALLVGLTLRFMGLSATANLVQVLSVIPPVIGAGLDFARGRRDGSVGKVCCEVDFPGLLDKVAEIHGISRDKIRRALTGWDTDALLDGDKPLEWDFVSALLNVIADGDHDLREGLEYFVRSAWKAVRHPAQDTAQHGLTVVVRAATGRWVSATEMTVVADQTAGLLQESARQLEISWAVLLFTLGKYAESIHKLKTERDRRDAELSALRNARQRESDLSARVRQMDSELQVVKRQLAEAEDLRTRTYERWMETERQLQRARGLRDAAIAQAVLFRQRLAGLENRPIMAVPGRQPQLSRADQVVGETDWQVGEQILIHADDLLARTNTEIGEQEATIDGLVSVASEGSSAPPPPRGRRRAVLALAAAAAVVAASLAAVNLPGGAARHGTGSGRPAAGVSPGPMRPTPAGPHLVATLHGGAGYIPESVSFGSDETVAVATTFSEGGNGTTYVWNLAVPHSPPASLPDPGTRGVRAVVFNHEGTKLAAVDANGRTYLWTVSDAQAGPVPLADPRTKGHSNSPQAVAFSPGGPALDKVGADASVLAVGDANGSTYVWNLAAPHTPRFTLPAPAGAYGVRAVAFDPYPYSTTLAVGDGNGNTYLWNLAAPRSSPARLPDPGSGGVVAVAYSADGNLLAVSDDNGYTYVWNTAERKIVFTYSDPGTTGVEAAAFSSPRANTYTLAVGDINHSAYLWNVGASAGAFPLHALGESLGVCSVAFSPDGLTLATANHDGYTYIWRLPASFP